MHIIENPAVPLTTPIVHGMNVDAKIEIEGTPYPGVHNGFTVELLTPLGNIFHMDVRFHQNALIFNHCHAGAWHVEERHGNPFHLGKHFHLKIKNHPGHFAIHVNGHHVCHFHHRGDPHHITALHIRGDVGIHKIHFENFFGNNGGGVQVGGGGVPVVTAPPVVIAAPPHPVVVAPAAPAVVVVEEGHHHHHHPGAAVAGAVVGGAIVGSAVRHHRRW